MTVPFIDTDVLIRLLTGDDPAKQAAAAGLFTEIENGTATAAMSVTTVANATYVLTSSRLYALPRTQAAALLTAIVRLPNLLVTGRRRMLRALDLLATTNLDFGDAFTVAEMEMEGSIVIYSYDRDFDRIPGVSRREP